MSKRTYDFEFEEILEYTGQNETLTPKQKVVDKSIIDLFSMPDEVAYIYQDTVFLQSEISNTDDGTPNIKTYAKHLSNGSEPSMDFSSDILCYIDDYQVPLNGSLMLMPEE